MYSKESSNTASNPHNAFESAPPTIDALLIRPHKHPESVKIGCDCAALEKVIGGSIEVCFPFEDPVALVVNGTGKMDGCTLNRALYDAHGNMVDIIAGDFLVVGISERDFESLSSDLAKKFKERFHRPELFVDAGGILLAIPMSDNDTNHLGRHSKSSTH